MDPRVLILEPGNQLLSIDTARSNGALGPAFLIGALREQGIAADYLDATIGRTLEDLPRTFYNRVEQENGLVRYGMSPEELADTLSQYDVIATSSIFTLQTRMHFEVAKIARKVAAQRGREILLVSGGVNARALRGHFLRNGFDVVALADGEQTLVDIVREFSRTDRDFGRISGISYLKDGQVVDRSACESGARKDLDHLPFPAWEAFPLDVYEHLSAPQARVRLDKGVKFAGIQTSRGCQDSCTFCHISMEKQQLDLVGRIAFLRGFTPERVGQEVDRAYALGVRRLYFEDDNLFYSKKRLTELAPFLKREGLEYSNVNGANLRFLFRKEGSQFVVDREFIDVLKDFGLRELTLPFETNNQAMMDKYASGKYRPATMDPFALIRALKDAGIQLAGNFMIGFRDESWESVLGTKELAKRARAAGLDGATFMIPVPYPGTADFEVVMMNRTTRADFESNLLTYTDHMHWRGRPLFRTAVSAERLRAAVKEFWLEVNDADFLQAKSSTNVMRRDVGAAA